MILEGDESVKKIVKNNTFYRDHRSRINSIFNASMNALHPQLQARQTIYLLKFQMHFTIMAGRKYNFHFR